MSFLLNCPNCGQREFEEFRYGGEVREPPGETPEIASWTDYLYKRGNVAGTQREWWYHLAGCRCWFVAQRDVRTNDVRQAPVATGAEPPARTIEAERAI